MPEYKLALATDDDIDDVIDMIKDQFYKSSPYSDLSFSYDKTEISVISLLQHKESLILLAKNGDENVGMFIATTTSPLFSDDRIATELFLYVRPGNAPALQMLRNGYEWWAKNKMKAVGTTLSYVDNEQGSRLGKVYKRWGYTPTEQSFLKRF